jgi:hypothetical protein
MTNGTNKGIIKRKADKDDVSRLLYDLRGNITPNLQLLTCVEIGRLTICVRLPATLFTRLYAVWTNFYDCAKEKKLDIAFQRMMRT